MNIEERIALYHEVRAWAKEKHYTVLFEIMNPDGTTKWSGGYTQAISNYINKALTIVLLGDTLDQDVEFTRSVW